MARIHGRGAPRALTFGAFFPRLLDRVDVGVYLQVGIPGGRLLSAGESVNVGGGKRPFFHDEGRIAFAANDVAIRYENAVLYSRGITFTIPLDVFAGAEG